MSKKSFRVPLSIQYLSFYILILVLPIFFLGYIIHFYLLSYMEGQVQASNEQKLIQVKDMVDTKLSEFHKISMQISSQRELTPYYVNNFFDIYQSKKLLNYKIGNDFIDELFYYIRGSDYLFSGESSYKLSLFANQYYQFERWTPEQFEEDINHADSPFLREPEEITFFNRKLSTIIVYGVPVPFNSNNPYGTILFFIKQDTMKDMLTNVVKSPEGNAYILDENNRVVAGLYNRKDELAEFKKQFNGKNIDHMQSIDIEGQTFYISQVKSNFLDWNYITLTPENELMSEVNQVKSKVLLSYGIILLIGILLIYIGMRMNYKPLGKLIHRAENIWARSASNRHGLDKIWDGIIYSEKRNQLLSERVENSRPLLQQHLLIRLLRGEITNFEQFNELGIEMDLTLKSSSYYVMLMEFQHKGKKDENLVKEWISTLPGVEKYQIDLFETSKIAIILSGNMDQFLLNEWYQKVVIPTSSVTIGVGNNYNEATQIGKSHLEATTALNYQLIKGNNHIIFFSETLADKTLTKWYDREILNQLELSLRKRNKDQVRLTMEKITKVIKSPDANLFFAKCLMFDVSGTIMRVIHDIQLTHHDLGSKLPDVLQIGDFHTIEQMEETVTKMIQTVFEFYDETESDDQLLHNILTYLKESYHDDQFSISALADHLSLSEPYIMRYFKKQTGETILQHLNRFRMNHAKELLKSSDLQIKEIAIQIGYTDVSSFIRKFKQEEKLTPGEYRKIHIEHSQKKLG